MIVDAEHPEMRPLYGPIRSLVYSASECAVRHVFVDGRQVVKDGKALGFDYADAVGRLEQAQRRVIERIPSLDWGKRAAIEIMPPTFPDGHWFRGKTP